MIIDFGISTRMSTRMSLVGVVVSSDKNTLTIAEGNAGNKNVSGILTRDRDDQIGCYIRIPQDYAYDGWKTDFKTGQTKMAGLAGE